MADPKIRWNVTTGVTAGNLQTQLNTVSDSGYTVHNVVHDGTNYTIIAWRKEFI